MSGSRFVKDQATEFAVYGAGMVLVMLVFVGIGESHFLPGLRYVQPFSAIRYEYQDYKEEDEKTRESQDELVMKDRDSRE